MRIYKLVTVFIFLATLIGFVLFINLDTTTQFDSIKREVESALTTREPQQTQEVLEEAKSHLEAPQTLLLVGATEMYRGQTQSALEKFDQVQMALGKLPLKTQTELLPTLTFLSTTALLRKIGPFGGQTSFTIAGVPTQEEPQNTFYILKAPIERIVKDTFLPSNGRKFYEGLQAYIAKNYEKAVEIWKTPTQTTQELSQPEEGAESSLKNMDQRSSSMRSSSMEELAFEATIPKEYQAIFLLLCHTHLGNLQEINELIPNLQKMLALLSEQDAKELLRQIFSLYSDSLKKMPVEAIDNGFLLVQSIKSTPYHRFGSTLLQQLLLLYFEENLKSISPDRLTAIALHLSTTLPEPDQKSFIRNLIYQVVNETKNSPLGDYNPSLHFIKSLASSPSIRSYTARELCNLAINLYQEPAGAQESSIELVSKILDTIPQIDSQLGLKDAFLPTAQNAFLSRISMPSVSNQTLEAMFDILLQLNPTEQQLLSLEEQFFNGISQNHLYLLIPGRPALIYTITNKIPQYLSPEGILALEDILHEIFLTSDITAANGELLPLLTHIEGQYDVDRHIKRTIKEHIQEYLAVIDKEIVQGNYETSQKLLTFLLEISPGNQETLILLGKTAFFKRDFNNTSIYLSQLATPSKEQLWQMQYAKLLEQAQGSINALSELYLSGKISQEALFIEAFYLTKKGAYEEARTLFALGDATQEGGIGLALIHALQEEWQQALSALNLLSPRATLLPPALSLRLVCTLQLRLLTQAKATFARLNAPSLLLEISSSARLFSQEHAFCRREYACGCYTLEVLDEPQAAEELFAYLPTTSPWRYFGRIRCRLEVQDLKFAQERLRLIRNNQERMFSKGDLTKQYFDELAELEVLLEIGKYNFPIAQEKIEDTKNLKKKRRLRHKLTYATQDYSGWLKFIVEEFEDEQNTPKGNSEAAPIEGEAKQEVSKETPLAKRFSQLFPKEQLAVINALSRSQSIPKAIGFAQTLLEKLELPTKSRFELARLIAPYALSVAEPIYLSLKYAIAETDPHWQTECNQDILVAQVRLLHYFLDWKSLDLLESKIPFDDLSPQALVAFAAVATALEEQEWADTLIQEAVHKAPEFPPAELLLANTIPSPEQSHTAINMTQLLLTHVERQTPIKTLLSALRLSASLKVVSPGEKEEIFYLLNELELYFRALSSKMSEVPQYLYWIGICLAERDDAQAIKTFETALSLDPSYSDAAFRLAAAYANASLFVRARHALEQGLAFDPKNSQAWKLMYKVDVSLGDIYAQLISSTQLTLLEPFNVQALQYQAKALLGLQDPNGAITALEKAEKLDPNNTTTTELLDQAKKLLFRFR